MQKFLETILNQCLNILESDAGSILLLDKSKRDIVVRVARGNNSQSILGQRVRLGEGISGLVALRKEPLLIEDVRTDEKIRSYCRINNYQTHSFLSVPLIREGRLLGVLNVTEKNDGKPFSIKELTYVSSITSCAAMSIEHMLFNEHLEKEVKCFKNSTAVTKFTSAIAHELNNPLDGVMRYVNICKSHVSENSVISEYLTEMQSGLNRMAKILRSMIEFSFAGDRNFSPVEKNIVDVNNVLIETLSFYQHHALHNHIDIETELDSNLPLIRDCGLQPIFVNFTQNALDAIVENGKLQVKSYQEDDNICVDFIDTGVGVDAQLKDKIFDPFFTTKTAGKGLGLAIVKEIVGCYDGKITVEKVFAGGARFTVKLPIGG